MSFTSSVPVRLRNQHPETGSISWQLHCENLMQGHNILCQGGLLLRGTDDEGVCVLVVTDHFVHE
jgi:hypothetical protein